MKGISKNSCIARSQRYTVQCTPRGRTVYVYNQNGDEIAKFQDMKYTFRALISPNEEQIVLLSRCGMIAIYSTEEMKLIKKVQYGHDGQDSNFCFSSDGTKLYIIEHFISKNGHPCGRLISYDTENYDEKNIEIDLPKIQLLNVIAAQSRDELFLIGYKRNSEGIGILNFIAYVKERQIVDIRYLKNEKLFSALKDFTDLDHTEIVECFYALPLPRIPLDKEITIYEQWELFELIIDVQDATTEYCEILQTPAELKKGDFKSIYENEYRITLKKFSDSLVKFNEQIHMHRQKSPFEEIINTLPEIDAKYINEKCRSFLNSFFGI